MTSPAVRRRAALLLKLLVSGALLAVLISRVDLAALWAQARTASPIWLLTALTLYLVMVLISAWRWGLLLGTVPVPASGRLLLTSFLVATFFNNFLPSNIGGDVVRIADTARPAGSKTIATLVVLTDRAIGLLGLLLVAALGASLASGLPGTGIVGPSVLWTALAAGLGAGLTLIWHPSLLPTVLGPIRRVHPEWIGERLQRLGDLLTRFRASPSALARCFAGAVVVQALLVAFYMSIARSLYLPLSYWQLALIVPMTFLVQMLPVSLNGFGVREATFAYYFTRVGLTLEQALLVSFMGAAMMAVFSLSGAAAYLARGRQTLDSIQESP